MYCIETAEKLTLEYSMDQAGCLQTHSTSDVSDMTYVFPVWDLLSGWYVLEVRQNGRLSRSELFVKRCLSGQSNGSNIDQRRGDSLK